MSATHLFYDVHQGPVYLFSHCVMYPKEIQMSNKYQKPLSQVWISVAA